MFKILLNEIQQNQKLFDLKSLLKENKITQSQLAKKLEVNRSTITNILNNQKTITVGRLHEIMAILGYKLQFNITKE